VAPSSTTIRFASNSRRILIRSPVVDINTLATPKGVAVID
jgi:hypothetical protein